MDDGGLMAMHVAHFGMSTVKAVTWRTDGEYSLLFDPTRCTLLDSWLGRLRYGADRFGLSTPATPDAEKSFVPMRDSSWETPPDLERRYEGYYRSGDNVVFTYRFGPTRLLDCSMVSQRRIFRRLQWTGQLDEARLKLFNATEVPRVMGESEDGQWRRIEVRTGDVWHHISCSPPAALIVSDNDVALLPQASDDQTVLLVIQPLPDHHDTTSSQPLHSVVEAEREFRIEELSSYTRGGASRWSSHPTTTQGVRGRDKTAYAIDTLTIPYDDANSFGTPFRIGGVDFLSKDRAVVATLAGDVWLVEGLADPQLKLKWRRIAAGLYQPLGIAVVNGQILVTGRDQITRLVDHNHDDEIDFYECVTNEYVTGEGGAFVTELHADDRGRLYCFNPMSGILRIDPRQPSMELMGSGLRNVNGMGVSRDGAIVLATTQEGPWTAATGIHEVRNGSYHGLDGPREQIPPYGYQQPLCYVPRGIDHSAGGLLFVPEDPRTGPLSGQILGSSFGNGSHYLVLRETTRSTDPRRIAVQGGVVPLAGEFLSGAHRMRWNPHDGMIYVAGTEGWQSYAQQNGSLQRLRYTGTPLPLPVAVETRSNGFLIRYANPLDVQSIRLERAFAQQWNYLYSAAYGSPEYSIEQPGRRGHDRVPIRSLHLLPDQRSVFVEVPSLQPVMQFHLYLELADVQGHPFDTDLYYSVFELGEPFTDFEGYEATEKAPPVPFPQFEQYPLDPRLVRQENLGKDFSTLRGVVTLELTASPGLQYTPRQLRVPPGQRVALVLRNQDPSMPHNWALIQPERFQAIGAETMRLAADPRAVAMHYVPDDPGIIAFAPILQSGEQYTVYFDAPQQTGSYPFACTFPGHWQIMRGVLHVLDPGEPMPELPLEQPARSFVRQWKLDDFDPELTRSDHTSVERGQALFHEIGCIKCHVHHGHGPSLGPPLNQLAQRHQGRKLLQHMLEPSLEVHPEYQTLVVTTRDGRIVTGLVAGRGGDRLTLVPNPLEPETKVTLAQDQIEQIDHSPLSTMPDGLLVTLDQSEILDLVRFLEQSRMNMTRTDAE
jgi:putative heme-binding domain-containing protein